MRLADISQNIESLSDSELRDLHNALLNQRVPREVKKKKAKEILSEALTKPKKKKKELSELSTAELLALLEKEK